jgi:hypothetical protein
MVTYKNLGLSKSAIGRILSASRKPEFHQLATPEGLRDWLAAGNDLSDAVSGIGDITEKAILDAMANLPPAGSTELNNETTNENEELETEQIIDKPARDADDDVKVIQVMMEVPVAQMRAGHEAKQALGGKLNFARRLTRKTQVHLSPDEAVCFLQIREGLLHSNIRLNNGEPIKSNADVIRWLVGQVIVAAH